MSTALRFAKYCARRVFYSRMVREFLLLMVFSIAIVGFFVGSLLILGAYPVAFFSVGAAVIVGTLVALAWSDFKNTDKGVSDADR